jgi:hypothetical protein
VWGKSGVPKAVENFPLELEIWGQETQEVLKGSRSPWFPGSSGRALSPVSRGASPAAESRRDPEYWLEMSRCNQTLAFESCMIGGGPLQIEHLTLPWKVVERSRTTTDG